MGIPLYVTFCFSLADFTIFSLYLIFLSLINLCLSMLLLVLILCETLCTLWTWVAISFPMLGKFLTIMSSNIFSDPFSFSSSSETPIIWMFVHLMLSQISLRLSSFLFILFSLLSSSTVISTILSSSSLIRFSVSVTLLLISSSVFFISTIVLFIREGRKGEGGQDSAPYGGWGRREVPMLEGVHSQWGDQWRWRGTFEGSGNQRGKKPASPRPAWVLVSLLGSWAWNPNPGSPSGHVGPQDWALSPPRLPPAVPAPAGMPVEACILAGLHRPCAPGQLQEQTLVREKHAEVGLTQQVQRPT